MSSKERIGTAILIGLLTVLGAILILTIDRPSGPGRGFSDNVIVQQRLINVNKNK